MKFSVIIPTYNDWTRLMQCVNALEKQTLGKGQFEIIVVNNNENSDLPSDLRLPDQVQLVHEPKPGSYIARNKGADLATGEILAFTDSDCIPDKKWLINAAAHFNESSCDLLGGRIQIFKSNDSDKYGYLYDRITAFPQHKNIPEGKGVTANLFVKKKVFEEAGGFDAAIKSGGDWEFTQRCTEIGYKMLYAEDVVVLHPARSIKAILKKQYRLTCGGAINVQNKYGHSSLRIMGSHLLHGLNFKREDLQKELTARERAVIFVIDLLRYLYRTIIHWGLLIGLINPTKVRE